MKFLIDENIGYRVVNFLRSQDHNVISVLEEFRGEKDSIILKRARIADRIVVTYDKDFGKLVFKSKIKHKGAILLRTRDESSKTQIKVLKKFLTSHSEKEIKNNFWVLNKAGARKAAII